MDLLPTVQMPDTGEVSTIKARQLQKSLAGTTGMTEKQRQQAKKVSQDFETLFIGMMMKSMRDTVPAKETLTGGGRGEETFRSLLDHEYAAAAVKNKSVGLAKIIEKEIIRHESGRSKPIIDHHE